MIGGSICNGYRGSVARFLQGMGPVDSWVIPRHLGSPGLLEELRRVLDHGPCQVIHFNLGPHGRQEGRIQKGEYTDLLGRYFLFLQAHAPGASLVWASTTPIPVKGKPTLLDPARDPVIARRNILARKAAADFGISLDDLCDPALRSMDLRSEDGFHFTREGFEILGRQVAGAVQAALEARREKPSRPPHSVLRRPLGPARRLIDRFPP